MTPSPRIQIEAGAWYWEKWSRFLDESISKSLRMTKEPSSNPVYEPQFNFNIASKCRDSMLFRYAKGEAIVDVGFHFEDLLDAWERSNEFADEVCKEQGLNECRDWTFELSDLSHYNWCFWIVGLALALNVPDAHWRRLLALIGGEGEDELLDRVIASRQPDRVIGKGALHAKPYARLLLAIDAPERERSALLYEFVAHWYEELGEVGDERLWWYHLGEVTQYPLDKYLYFGRWCVEAVAAAQALGIDDALCLAHPHYPGDLREDGRSPRYPLGGRQGPALAGVQFGTASKKSRLSDWMIQVLTGSSSARR